MRINSKLRRSILSSVVAIAMAGSLSLSPALASAQEPKVLTTGSGSSGVPEWAIDDGGSAQKGDLSVQAAIPSTYDLRTEGLVTPVKFQNPWGSCWAFGGTAAAETSILSAYGSTYAKSKLDLSEKHLTYFALQPISETEDPAQAGEGLYTLDTSTNAAFDAGGQPVYITTLYSQGVGPMLESLFPYRGKEAITVAQSYEAHPEYLDEDTKDQISLAATGSGMTYDDFMAKSAANRGMTLDEVYDYFKNQVSQIAIDRPMYSKHDDWSIPQTNADGTSNRLVSNGVVLKNGNVLPEYWARAADEDPSEESINAIKQELLNGRGVTIMYWADQGGPYSAAPGASVNGNTNHNQYVYEAGTGIDHGVEIVGWDDAYAKENFTHGATPEAQAASTPKSDGAWIVKNSWGSETDATAENADDLGHIMNKGPFGNLDSDGKATGYFYLSYYDRSIQQPETMEFSANLGTEGSFAALQYDYMPASSGFYKTPASSTVVSSANVFSADGTDITVKSVSTRTTETNMRVTFAIYRLNDDAKDPSDGEMVYRTSQNFMYGGFHRLDLEMPITFTAGTKFSVIATASTLGESGKRSYSVSANRGLSKDATEYVIEHFGAKLKIYSVAVVKKGESFLYDGKEWKDWSEYLAALPPDHETLATMPSETYTAVCPVDNFSIKVYAEPADAQAVALEAAQKAQKDAEAAQKAAEDKAAGAEKAQKAAEDKAAEAAKAQKAAEDKVAEAAKAQKAAEDKAASVEKALASSLKANTMKVSAKSLKAKAKKAKTFTKSQAFAVKNAKGKVTFYKLSGNSKITVTTAGKVKVAKGLKAGTYKVKVLVVAKGGKVKGVKYAPANKTVTLKVQMK